MLFFKTLLFFSFICIYIYIVFTYTNYESITHLNFHCIILVALYISITLYNCIFSRYWEHSQTRKIRRLGGHNMRRKAFAWFQAIIMYIFLYFYLCSHYIYIYIYIHIYSMIYAIIYIIAWTCFDDKIWKWVPFSYSASSPLHIVLSPVFHLDINNIFYS